MHHLFGIDTYLKEVFLTQHHLERAQGAIRAIERGEESDFETVEAATAWLHRVERWRENLRTDLILDSVLAPDGSFLVEPEMVLCVQVHSSLHNGLEEVAMAVHLMLPVFL